MNSNPGGGVGLEVGYLTTPTPSSQPGFKTVIGGGKGEGPTCEQLNLLITKSEQPPVSESENNVSGESKI